MKFTHQTRYETQHRREWERERERERGGGGTDRLTEKQRQKASWCVSQEYLFSCADVSLPHRLRSGLLSLVLGSMIFSSRRYVPVVTDELFR